MKSRSRTDLQTLQGCKCRQLGLQADLIGLKHGQLPHLRKAAQPLSRALSHSQPLKQGHLAEVIKVEHLLAVLETSNEESWLSG